MSNTQKRILQAFYDLVQNYSFDCITIDMILKKSEVSKSTFYRYFHDKYELMDLYYRDSLNKIFKNADNLSWFDTTYLIIEFLNKHETFFKNIFKTEGQNSFFNFLSEYTVLFCKNTYIRNKGSEDLSFEESAAIELYCYGSVAITKKWVCSGMPQSPKELAELFDKCIPAHIRIYL